MDSATAITLARFPMEAGQAFRELSHDAHQLAWVRDGVLTVTVGQRNWTLPPSLALWIPAGVPHTSAATRAAATMQGVYLSPHLLPEWDAPTVVAITPLVRELIDYLADPGIPSAARAKAEELMPELLEPTQVLTIDVPLPRDSRTAGIADALLVDPGDDRDLARWGRVVGASARTLSRLFPQETGLGFAQWRSRLRLQASLAHLADGESVGTTAALVGFSSTSAYIQAFGALTGMTPGAYLAGMRRAAAEPMESGPMASERHDLSA
ncbi:MAG TPA: helix-turn-helix transcriptional regulator [Cellulomonas sp.]